MRSRSSLRSIGTFGVLAGLVVGACSPAANTASSAAPSATTAPAATATAAAPSQSAAAENVAITVVSLKPGSEQTAFDAFDAQVKQFEDANPNIDVTAQEYEWTGPTFAAQLAGGTLPDVFTIPFTDGKSLIEQGQLADIYRRGRAAAVRHEVQPERARRRSGRERHHLRPADGGLRHRPAVQPQAVRGSGPRPEQAARDVGRHPGRGQGDRRQDRAGRLLPDDPEQHRRLDADHADLRDGRPDADQRQRKDHLDPRQPGHEGGPRDAEVVPLGR